MSHYRNSGRFDRIDQDEVPESKHTLFIRGLPGYLKTDEVKDFFEDHIGPCSFDFIKISPDQLKLFVAVRFETREAAKECMSRYSDGEVLGHPVEVTWFKDIRRYISYQQSQGLRPATVPRNRYGGNRTNSNNRGNYERTSRTDFRDEDYEKTKRTTSGDRRSYSKSPSRSRSRSVHDSREHSVTPGSRRTPGSTKLSRSRSRGSSSAEEGSISLPSGPPPQAKRSTEGIEKGSTPPLPPSPAPASATVAKQAPKEVEVQSTKIVRSPNGSPPVEERKSRKSKKDKKKKRRRSPTSSSASSSERDHSSEELSESELRKKILKKRQKSLRAEAEVKEMNANGKTLGKWEEKEAGEPTRNESSILQNTTLKFGLESNEDIPKRIVKESPPTLQQKKQPSKNVIDTMMPRPLKIELGETGPAVKNLHDIADAKIESFKTTAPAATSMFGIDVDSLLGKKSSAAPASTSGFLEDIGSQIPMSARGQQQQASVRGQLDELEEPMPSSGLRLSSFTRQITAETERERKLASLPPELVAKFVLKKKQFDASMKADCETFAFVVKLLVQKDPGLEARLRLALSEVVKDMEDKFTEKTDQYLDQLIALVTSV